MSKLIRLRDRNQVTLPDEVTRSLGLREDDYLAVHVTGTGHIQLTPTRLVRVGTPQAEALRKEAEEDVHAGRYETYSGAQELTEALLKRVGGRSAGTREPLTGNRTKRRAARRVVRRAEPAGQR